MAIFRGSMSCDSCSTAFDGDPIDLIGVNDSIASGIRNPEHRKMIQDFWLCGDCAPDYAGGVKDFFVASVFENEEPVCDSCEIDFERMGTPMRLLRLVGVSRSVDPNRATLAHRERGFCFTRRSIFIFSHLDTRSTATT